MQGEALRDHAAHRRAADVRPRDAERIEHAGRVARHVAERVRRVHRQPQRVAQGRGDDVGHAEVIEALRQAGVAVVEAHDAKALGDEALHQLVGPADELHAEPHDEQQRLAVARPLVVDLDGDAVAE